MAGSSTPTPPAPHERDYAGLESPPFGCSQGQRDLRLDWREQSPVVRAKGTMKKFFNALLWVLIIIAAAYVIHEIASAFTQ